MRHSCDLAALQTSPPCQKPVLVATHAGSMELDRYTDNANVLEETEVKYRAKEGIDVMSHPYPY